MSDCQCIASYKRSHECQNVSSITVQYLRVPESIKSKDQYTPVVQHPQLQYSTGSLDTVCFSPPWSICPATIPTETPSPFGQWPITIIRSQLSDYYLKRTAYVHPMGTGSNMMMECPPDPWPPSFCVNPIVTQPSASNSFFSSPRPVPSCDHKNGRQASVLHPDPDRRPPAMRGHFHGPMADLVMGSAAALGRSQLEVRLVVGHEGVLGRRSGQGAEVASGPIVFVESA